MEESRETLNIKVLMYHRVVSDPDQIIDYWHAVHDEQFRQQLRLLERFNFTPITFEDYQLYLDGQLTLPRKPIIITFDDGHQDTFEVAAPILDEFNMKAVVFVMGNRRLSSALWDEQSTDISFPLMSDDQIYQLRAQGFEIGAHSMNHRILPNLNLDNCIDEVWGSKESIEQLLGEPIQSFSYPYGRLDNRVQAIVREAGYKNACGVYTGPARFADDPFNYRRLAINNDIGLTSFMLRLLTPYEYAEWMYNKVRNPEDITPDQVEREIEKKIQDLVNKPTENLQFPESSKHYIS